MLMRIPMAALAVALMLFLAPAGFAQDPPPDGEPENDPTVIGPAQAGMQEGVDGVPNGATRIRATTGSAAQANQPGRVVMWVANETTRPATDFHLKIRTSGVRLNGIRVRTGYLNPATPWSDVSIDNDKLGGSAAAGEGQDAMPIKSDGLISGSITLDFEDENGTPVEGTLVEFDAWWTRNNMAIREKSTETIGDHASKSIDQVVPGLDRAPKEITVGELEAADGSTIQINAPDLALAEVFGYQFQTGDFVLTSGTYASFDISTVEFEIYDENGNPVEAGDAVISHVREIGAGNLAFRVTRDPEFSPAIVLVIRNLKITVHGGGWTKRPYYLGANGAALGGACIGTLFHAFTVVD